MLTALLSHSGGIRMKDKKHYGGLDAFRLIAALLVIAIHTSKTFKKFSERALVYYTTLCYN